MNNQKLRLITIALVTIIIIITGFISILKPSRPKKIY